jgi:hypothetical protein
MAGRLVWEGADSTRIRISGMGNHPRQLVWVCTYVQVKRRMDDSFNCISLRLPNTHPHESQGAQDVCL